MRPDRYISQRAAMLLTDRLPRWSHEALVCLDGSHYWLRRTTPAELAQHRRKWLLYDAGWWMLVDGKAVLRYPEGC